MSEFFCTVLQLPKVGKHRNADSLSIVQVLGEYPVIFRSDEFKEGDKVVFISPDSMVPLADDRWAFLRDGKYDPANPGYFRIKAKRLRGIFSCGIFTKADDSWQPGQDVRNELSIKKYEYVSPINMKGDSESNPLEIPEYTDVEGLRKFPNVLQEGEEVVLSEKVHGASARFLYSDNRLWIGSHHQIKKEDPSGIWWKVAEQYKLKEILVNYPDLLLFGEVYGWVQDLHYGVEKGQVRLVLFDILNFKTRRYLDFDEFAKVSENMGIPTVPVLYRGPWNKDLRNLSEGQSTVPGADCIREGFCVKPIKERFDIEVGRVILKLPGETYLTRKEN